MKKLLYISAIAFLCACAPQSYYQLYKVSTNGLEQKNNCLTFENEHCIVSYNLWGESGDLSFLLYNKTDKDMFVIMPQSFFIKNGIAYDYYTNAIHISRLVVQSGKATSYANSYASIFGNSALGIGRAATYAEAATAENSTTTKEMAVICIPPRAAKSFNGFQLIADAYKDCDDYEFNYPKKVSDFITYEKDDSPWKFRNRIAYTFDETNQTCEYIENELWVSYLQNYYYSEMEKRIKATTCETNYSTTTTIILNEAPNSFYNSYKKTAGATKSSTPINLEGGNDEVYSIRRR